MILTGIDIRTVGDTYDKKTKTKRSFYNMIVFIKLVVLLRIPLLTIVKEERRKEETALKGIGSYH